MEYKTQIQKKSIISIKLSSEQDSLLRENIEDEDLLSNKCDNQKKLKDTLLNNPCMIQKQI